MHLLPCKKTGLDHPLVGLFNKAHNRRAGEEGKEEIAPQVVLWEGCMGDPERWPQASSLTPEGVSLFSAAFSASVAKGNDWWAKAEEWAAELITCIQPTWSSEKRRQSVVDYVQFLIRRGIDCQVGVLKIPLFGSCALEAQLGC